MKGKNPPATNRIGALISKLLDIPFNLYYVKGKDLILTDFLSRIRADRSEPSELIPISFMDMTRCNFPESYNLSYKRCWYAQLQLGVATRSSTRKEGLVLPKVHGHDKPIDPHKKPEHQPLPTPKVAHPAAPVQLPPANKMFTPPHVVDRSKLTSINKKPSAAYIASRKLKEKSIKIAQQPRANPPKAPRHRKQITHQIEPQKQEPKLVDLPRNPSMQVPVSSDKKVEPTVNPVSSFTPGEIPLQNQVPSNKNQLVPTTLLPPDFAVEDPQTPVQHPGFDPGVDINTPTANYGDLVGVAYQQPTKDDLIEPVLLANLVEHSRLLHTEHPKQKDIKAILKVINQKILRQVHLPNLLSRYAQSIPR